MFQSYIRRPRAAAQALTPLQVARAYNYPDATGAGFTCGIIELGGGFSRKDLDAFFGRYKLPTPSITSVPVAGGQNKSDGPNGADGEVLLDIEVAGAVAPGANFRVYFSPNTDQGFLKAIQQAVADGCDVISISWGGPEDSWDPASIKLFNAAFLDARKKGVITFAAAGDTGSRDGESHAVTDYPASDPNVIACGGTRLEVDGTGDRTTEVTWNDNPTQSATGGGISRAFPGRQVPDVAGNADPQTGYEVLVDGQWFVIGGTSAVAPLYAALALRLSQVVGQRLGGRVDFMNTLLTNMGVCFDVTAGDNGDYRAGVGRDETTGLGVVDGARLAAVLTDNIADPAPIGGSPAPVPTPTPAPVPAPTGGGASFQLSAAVTARVDSAAARAHVSPEEWLEHRMRTYFGIH